MTKPDENPSWGSNKTLDVVKEIRAQWGDNAKLLDINALEAYASQIATLRQAQARIEVEGLVIADPKGNPIPHPCIAIAKTAQTEIRAWGTQFRPKRTRQPNH